MKQKVKKKEILLLKNDLELNIQRKKNKDYKIKHLKILKKNYIMQKNYC